MSQTAASFSQLILALAGAGLVYYGAGLMCDDKNTAAQLASCLKQPLKKGVTKDAASKGCKTRYDASGETMHKVVMWSGFGIIILGFLAMSILNSGMMSGMGGGMMGGGGYYQ